MSNIVVPVLGESIVEARIAKWLKKPGDHVEVGDPLVELETEKTNLELSAEKRGVITSIARKEGEDVKIGELLAVVDENGAGAPPPAAAQSGNGSKAASQSAPSAPAEQPKTTPTARRMAQDHEVDLGGVQGTGSAGRVTTFDLWKKRRGGSSSRSPGRPERSTACACSSGCATCPSRRT